MCTVCFGVPASLVPSSVLHCPTPTQSRVTLALFSVIPTSVLVTFTTQQHWYGYLRLFSNSSSDSEQIEIMADEDTDWSYSETIPKPQISTLSRFYLSFAGKCLYQLCFDCKLIYWELLRTNTSDYLFKVFCTTILLRL